MSGFASIGMAVAAEAGAVARLLTRQLAEHDLPADAARVTRAVDGILTDDRVGFLLVARRGDEVVGVSYVAMIWSLEHGGPSSWLEELYVLPAWRGQGVGAALLRVSLAQARERGCLMMDLEVTEDHARAAHLYAREGFVALPRGRWVRGL
ncbi:MAG: GNAT family N-acetyltransferase [bacterium]|nr:GNAT family N-acetyltransferase [bacterium]